MADQRPKRARVLKNPGYGYACGRCNHPFHCLSNVQSHVASCIADLTAAQPSAGAHRNDDGACDDVECCNTVMNVESLLGLCSERLSEAYLFPISVPAFVAVAKKTVGSLYIPSTSTCPYYNLHVDLVDSRAGHRITYYHQKSMLKNGKSNKKNVWSAVLLFSSELSPRITSTCMSVLIWMRCNSGGHGVPTNGIRKMDPAVSKAVTAILCRIRDVGCIV